jgi:hypothetical protein
MIFRAPPGHWLFKKKQLQKMLEDMKNGHLTKVEGELSFFIEEIEYMDEIRRKWELKKMMEEDGEDVTSLEQEIVDDLKKKQL